MAASRSASIRTLAAGSAVTWISAAIFEKRKDADTDADATQRWFDRPISPLHRGIANMMFAPSTCSMEAGAATLSNRTMAEPSVLAVSNGTDDADKPTRRMEFDFVILGHGNAGQAAVRELRARCPHASIAVIDPLRSLVGGRHTKYFSATACYFHPHEQTVRLVERDDLELRYRSGILVATGSRGAPPPMELFEKETLPKVLELRTTELVQDPIRPIMTPEQVRNKVLKAAKNRQRIGIVGSGWEALDLVCAASKYSGGSSSVYPPTIAFGGPGPAWHILPQYLSSEIRRKLMKKNVRVQDRSIVRYVGTSERQGRKMVELHTAKAYDLLDTQRASLDLLVVAPDASGTKGTAVLPTKETPDCMIGSSDGRPWYKTWSQLTKTSDCDPSVIVCYEDDGRIMVNAELCASSRVYAAGSVAKYPNSSTGHASIAGVGATDGGEAGRVAAVNMSRDYLERRILRSSSPILTESFATHSAPIWRSDVATFPSTTQLDAVIRTSLPYLGVQALCVGNCNSEKQSTRGFWWTNTSAQRKLAKSLEQEEEEARGSEEAGGAKETQRVVRRRNTKQRRKLGLPTTPLYGIGVVYYLDKLGRIRGIMTWGLPFVTMESNGTELNKILVDRIKHILATNGGISAIDSEENSQLMNKFLAKESQRLVRLAVQGYTAHGTTGLFHNLDGPIKGFSRPLYRYTEVQPSKNNSINVLKRKANDANGILGEDLFALDEVALEEKRVFYEMENQEEDGERNLNNLPKMMYPINLVSHNVEYAMMSEKLIPAKSLAEMNRFMAIQRGWENNNNRARPGKEDPLWLRPGDEKKSTTQQQVMSEAWNKLIFPHVT